MTRPALQAFFAERRSRLVEAVLLLLAFLTLFCGVALVGLTKVPAPGISAPLNINTATSAQLAKALGVSERRARAVVAARPKGGFGDVDALKRLRALDKTPLLPSGAVEPAENRLVVRSFADAYGDLRFWSAGIAVFFFVAHLLAWWRLPRADPFVLPIAAFLGGLSVLLLFAIKDPVRDRLSFVSQAQGIVFGGAVVFFGILPVLFSSRAKPHRYTYLYALAAVGACLLLLVAGKSTGGVRLSVAGVQPVEGVKTLLVFFLAAFLSERAPELDDPLRKGLPRAKDFLPLAVMYAFALGLFVIVRDLGPVLLLFGVFVAMLYGATGRGAYVLVGVALLLLGGYLGYRSGSGVFPTRLDMWLSPWHNTHPQGDHLALGLWGLSSGGGLGSGLGLGGTRFIPRGGSDLALASVGEEMGLPGSLGVLFCFLVLVARGFIIARQAATVFDRYLATGLAVLLGLQALLIASGTLGLFPLSGVTLPFVSLGKSSLIASLCAVGTLLYVSAKRTPDVPAPPQSPAQAKAERALGLFFFLTLGVVCVGRLLWLQGIAADAIAAQSVTVPDADKQERAHVNPRLAALARRIRRGDLLDRNGKPLATTNADGEREYPLGAAAAHVVGYMDGGRGIAGMERRFDDRLRGYKTLASLVPVWRTKNAPGFRLPQGETVTLSLDADLQQAAANALRETGKPRGAAVVMDAATGAVLAAASVPTFDPNGLTPKRMAPLVANRDGNFALLNRAVSGYYPPGSTFKIVSAAALIAGNRGDFRTDCAHSTSVAWQAGNIRHSRRRIGDDAGEAAHGDTDLNKAVAQSCNVYFARAAIELGAPALREHAALYGFAKLPTPAQFDAALPEIAFGQGEMLASPLEMVGVAQSVANRGKRLAPQWEKNAYPVIAATVLPEEKSAPIAAMMREATRIGTAAGRFDDLPFAVAGKTGTAQNREGDKQSHSWFIGFTEGGAPVAFAVIVENGGYGATRAVPVAKTILQKLL